MLSIIIPTLNEERYLPNLLASIRRQRFTEYEVIVSDGSSEDRTREIAEEFGCQVVVKPTRSPGYQRNRGTEVAHGKILLFLDADTLLPDEAFLVKALDELSRRGLGAACCYSAPIERAAHYHLLFGCSNLFLRLIYRLVPHAYGGSIFVKRELHDAVHGFSEAPLIGEDSDYVKQIGRISRFGLLHTVRTMVSMRRFEQDGFFRGVAIMTAAELVRSFGGKPRYDRFGYRFGHYSSTTSARLHRWRSLRSETNSLRDGSRIPD